MTSYQEREGMLQHLEVRPVLGVNHCSDEIKQFDGINVGDRREEGVKKINLMTVGQCFFSKHMEEASTYLAANKKALHIVASFVPLYISYSSRHTNIVTKHKLPPSFYRQLPCSPEH